MLQKIVSLISKDVCKENESKSLIVALRIVLLIMMVGLIAAEVCLLFNGLLMLAAVSFAFLLMFLSSFAATYRLGTLASYYLFSTITMLWVAFSIFERGWSAQLFIPLLLIMRFFEARSTVNSKAVFAAVLFVFAILLYIFLPTDGAVLDSPGVSEVLTVLNIIVSFGGIAVVCWSFSGNVLRDEKKLVLYNQRLQHDAATDTLTGLPNRRQMMHDLEKSIKRVKTLEQEIFSIAIGDIDHFKRVNDTLGHECGDVVLHELGKMFTRFIENKGKVARWGGEEFLFIFDNMNGDQALVELHSLVNEIRNHRITYKKETLQVTVTFGLEEYSVHCDLAENIKNADNKLYLGKSSGRNTVIY